MDNQTDEKGRRIIPANLLVYLQDSYSKRLKHHNGELAEKILNYLQASPTYDGENCSRQTIRRAIGLYEKNLHRIPEVKYQLLNFMSLDCSQLDLLKLLNQPNLWSYFTSNCTGPVKVRIPSSNTSNSSESKQLLQSVEEIKSLLKTQAEEYRKYTESILSKQNFYHEKQLSLLEESRNRQLEEHQNRIKQLEDDVKRITTVKSDNKYWKQIEAYFRQGKYSSYQKLLDSSGKESATTLAEIHYLKAKGYEAALLNEKAFISYEIAQRLQPQNPVYMNGLGRFLIIIADYPPAIKILGQALNLVEKSKTQNLYGTVLNNLGEAWLAMDNIEKSIIYFAKALDYNKSVPLPSNKNDLEKYYAPLATNQNNLGLAFMAKGEYQTAIDRYNEALKIRSKFLKKYPAEIASIKSHIGLVYKAQGKFTEALKQYDVAIKTSEKTLGKGHPNIANYLNNIAEVWRERSQFDKAIENYEKAVAIYKKLYKNGHPRLAGFFNNIGICFKEKGDCKKGIEYYKKSLEMNQRIYGRYHSSIGDNFNNIGLALHSLGEECKVRENQVKAKEYYKEAKQVYRNAVQVYRKIGHSEHPDTARVCSNLGGVFHSIGDFTKAIASFEKAKSIYEKFFGPNNIAVAYPIANLARVFDEQGKYDEAIRNYLAALKIFKSVLGLKSMPVAHCYNNLGQTWNSKGDKKKAIKNYKTALEIYKEILPPKNHFILKCQKELAAVVSLKN